MPIESASMTAIYAGTPSRPARLAQVTVIMLSRGPGVERSLIDYGSRE
jgi:hypothetical protein